MGTLLIEGPFRFYFFLSEPKYKTPHIHVSMGKGEAIFWLEPEVVLQKRNKHFSDKDLAHAKKIVLHHQENFLKEYYEKINPRHK